MASEQQMKNPLLVGKAIRAQLEHEVPQDLPLDRDFKEGTDYTITDQWVFNIHILLYFLIMFVKVLTSCTRSSVRTLAL